MSDLPKFTDLERMSESEGRRELVERWGVTDPVATMVGLPLTRSVSKAGAVELHRVSNGDVGHALNVSAGDGQPPWLRELLRDLVSTGQIGPVSTMRDGGAFLIIVQYQELHAGTGSYRVVEEDHRVLRVSPIDPLLDLDGFRNRDGAPRWNRPGARIRVYEMPFQLLPCERVQRYTIVRCTDDSSPAEDVLAFITLFGLYQAICESDEQIALRILCEAFRFTVHDRAQGAELLEAVFAVLRQPPVWRWNLPREERRRYLAKSAWNAIKRERGIVAIRGGEALKDQVDENTDPLRRLVERDFATKALALPNLRDGERRLLELILNGSANGLTDARKIADLPDSYRVGVIKKVKRALSR